MGVGVGRQVESLEALSTKPLGFLFRRQLVPHLRIFQFRRRIEYVTAFDIEIAGDAHEDE